MKTQLISGALIAFIAASFQATGEGVFDVGRKRLQKGRASEAFCAFLHVPGAAHLQNAVYTVWEGSESVAVPAASACGQDAQCH